jgi:hypothetical protein
LQWFGKDHIATVVIDDKNGGVTTTGGTDKATSWIGSNYTGDGFTLGKIGSSVIGGTGSSVDAVAGVAVGGGGLVECCFF